MPSAWPCATMQAPNTFYFIATDKYMYQLTPLGQYGDEMLKSFTLL